MRTILSPICILLAGLATAPVHAAESKDACQFLITSIPASLTSPGTWCLDKDLGTSLASGNAITVSTSNVTLDCNGFRISGLGAGAATMTYGVRASNRLNTHVRNCRIRGFMTGISVAGSGSLVEHNQLDGNTTFGITASGAASIVRDNVVHDTGGSTTVFDRVGIQTYGGVDVIDNLVDGVSGQEADQPVHGIFAVCCEAAGSIRGNRVRELDAGANGAAFGIRSTQYDTMIEGNHVLGLSQAGSVGIDCFSNEASSVRNIITNFADPLEGCYSVDDAINPN